MSMEVDSPVVEEQQQPSTDIKSACCICKRESNSLLLTCNGNACPCNNKYHPECFGMSPVEIQQALSSNSYFLPINMLFYVDHYVQCAKVKERDRIRHI